MTGNSVAQGFSKALCANLHHVIGVENTGVLLESVMTVQTDDLFVFAGLFWLQSWSCLWHTF